MRRRKKKDFYLLKTRFLYSLVVLSFFYTNELPSLDMDSSESSCDLASDCELADLSISIRRAVALFGVGKILQLTSLMQVHHGDHNKL